MTVSSIFLKPGKPLFWISRGFSRNADTPVHGKWRTFRGILPVRFFQALFSRAPFDDQGNLCHLRAVFFENLLFPRRYFCSVSLSRMSIKFFDSNLGKQFAAIDSSVWSMSIIWSQPSWPFSSCLDYNARYFPYLGGTSRPQLVGSSKSAGWQSQCLVRPKYTWNHQRRTQRKLRFWSREIHRLRGEESQRFKVKLSQAHLIHKFKAGCDFLLSIGWRIFCLVGSEFNFFKRMAKPHAMGNSTISWMDFSATFT